MFVIALYIAGEITYKISAKIIDKIIIKIIFEIVVLKYYKFPIWGIEINNSAVTYPVINPITEKIPLTIFFNT